MKTIIFYFFLCTSIFFTVSVSGQEIDKNYLETKIDALVPKAINDTTPGLVIGIVKNGELIFNKGYGLANLSYGIANSPQMVYNLGSVSKQFLGYAFAMLHVSGKLNLDDPVSKYLEDWPEFNHTVTIRNLLTHTSGYREAYTISNLAGRIIGIDRLSRNECLDVVRRQPKLEFIPGSRWTYNSTAYVILAEVLEKITGVEADKWVENNILKSLKMKSTQIENYVGEVINNSAESYIYDKTNQGYINKKSNRAIFGAAEVYSNIYDLAKWINNYRTSKIGGKKVSNLFLNPFILNDGTNSEYALGIGVNYYRGHKRYRHTGGHEAFLTQLSYYPEQDLGIILITNFGRKGWVESTKIADLFLPDDSTANEEAIKIENKKLKKLEGIYLASSLNKTFQLVLENDTLKLDGRIKLIPVSQQSFKLGESNDILQIEKNSNGSTQLVLNKNEVYTRADKWAPTEEELINFEGDYWSDEIETVYHLEVVNNKLLIKHRWLNEIKLEAISKDFFKSNWGFYLKFYRNKNGEISSFTINTSRTLNVVFNRKF